MFFHRSDLMLQMQLILNLPHLLTVLNGQEKKKAEKHPAKLMPDAGYSCAIWCDQAFILGQVTFYLVRLVCNQSLLKMEKSFLS